MNPKVDFFFDKAKAWQKEFEALRTIILGCGLTEELKWGQPCYTCQESNIILMHGFKEYCAVLFLKVLCCMMRMVYWYNKPRMCNRHGRFASTM